MFRFSRGTIGDVTEAFIVPLASISLEPKVKLEPKVGGSPSFEETNAGITVYFFSVASKGDGWISGSADASFLSIAKENGFRFVIVLDKAGGKVIGFVSNFASSF